jgi:hypothetical protein
LLDAISTVSEDEVSPVPAVGSALIDLHDSAYRLRAESVTEGMRRIP